MNVGYMEECKSMFNKIGVFGGSYLARLIGYGEDDRDCYYICKDESGRTQYYTMVGNFEPMDITHMPYTYTMWHNLCPEEKEFIIDLEL